MEHDVPSILNLPLLLLAVRSSHSLVVDCSLLPEMEAARGTLPLPLITIFLPVRRLRLPPCLSVAASPIDSGCDDGRDCGGSASQVTSRVYMMSPFLLRQHAVELSWIFPQRSEVEATLGPGRQPRRRVVR